MSISDYLLEHKLPYYWFDAADATETTWSATLGSSTLTVEDPNYPLVVSPTDVTLPTHRTTLLSSTSTSPAINNFTLIYGLYGVAPELARIPIDSLYILYSSSHRSVSSTLYRATLVSRTITALTDVPVDVEIPDMFACSIDKKELTYTTYRIKSRNMVCTVYSVCPVFIKYFLMHHSIKGPLSTLKHVIYCEPSLPFHRIEDLFRLFIGEYNDTLPEPPPPSGWDVFTESMWDNLTTDAWNAIA